MTASIKNTITITNTITTNTIIEAAEASLACEVGGTYSRLHSLACALDVEIINAHTCDERILIEKSDDFEIQIAIDASGNWNLTTYETDERGFAHEEYHWIDDSSDLIAHLARMV